MCDLGVTLEGSALEPHLDQLRAELAGRGLEFRPHSWLSGEWFCPDGVPGFAIPFYLAHPRLARLEEKQTLEVEGGTPEWCLRILRHEAGHAIENAYRLRAQRPPRALFGAAPSLSEVLPAPPLQPQLRRHLDGYYAQSHPTRTSRRPCGLAHAGYPGPRLRGLAGAAQARVRRRHHARAGRVPRPCRRGDRRPLWRIRKTLRATIAEAPATA